MLSLFFFIASSLCCVAVANMIRSETGKVVDIIHSKMPRITAPYLSDFLVLTQTVGTAAVVDINTLNEVFLIMSIVQFFRSICSLSTALPPLKNYHDKYRLGGINGTGTEYIFSGHASYSALAAIYLYQKGIVPAIPLVLFNLVSQFLIVATHNHYTVDVVLAWIVVPLLYSNLKFCRCVEWCNNIVDPLL